MSGDEPRVSVLLPAFNVGPHLDDALASLRRQTERRWQGVLVDDGSSDDTLDRARAAARADSRLKVVVTRHRGLVAALNTGLDHCAAPLVARMDADDLMHRRRLEEQADLLDRRTELDAVGCHVRLFPRAGLADGSRRYERWLNAIDSTALVAREAFIECPVAHPTLMIRRRILVRLGYRDRGWPEDYDLLLRLLADGRQVDVLSRRRLAWRQHAARLSRKAEAYRLDSFTRCRAYFLSRSFLADSPSYILWGHGGTGRALRRALERLGKRPAFIVEVHRGRLGNTIGGAQVIPIDRLSQVPRQPIVVSVARLEARTLIRQELRRMRFVEGRDFVCAA